MSSASATEGHCKKCGYDLRASVDRCPECGTPFVRPPHPVPVAIPPILLAHAPRRVHLRLCAQNRSGKPSLVIVLGIIALVLWLFFGARVLLVTMGEQLDGEIVGRSYTRSTRGGITRYITFSYESNGRHYTEKQAVTRGDAAGRSVGDTILVTRMSLLGIEMNTLTHSAGGTLIILLVFSILASIFLVAAVHEAFIAPATRRRLVSSGVPVIGQFIRKCGPIGKQGRQRLRYQYPIPGGLSCEKYVTVSKSFYDRTVVGQDVVIIRDRNNVNTAVVYDQCEYEAVAGTPHSANVSPKLAGHAR